MPGNIYVQKKIEVSRYKLINFYEEKAYVSTPNRVIYIINFFKNICIYLEFQNCYLSCCYTIAMCKNQVIDWKNFTLPIYTINNYYNIYSKDFVLNFISIKDLKSSISCLALLI